jgi:ATP-dependent exoDNAse (exonuclease V) beta subunit
MAAITFTRKAAGELRLRIRERLLETLAEPGLGGERAAQPERRSESSTLRMSARSTASPTGSCGCGRSRRS